MNKSQTDIYNALSKNPLFSDLTPSELEDLIVRHALSSRYYSSGKIIKFQGEPCRNLLLLVKGSITAGITKPDGKNIILERLTAPEAAASAIVFSDHGNLPVTLIAETDTELVFLSRETLLFLFQQHKSVLNRYLTDMGNKVSFLADKIRYLQMHTLRQKIITYLLELKKRQQSDLLIMDYSLETLSEMFGVTRPSLSREIGLLVEEQYLAREGKKIRVLKPSLLPRLINDL